MVVGYLRTQLGFYYTLITKDIICIIHDNMHYPQLSPVTDDGKPDVNEHSNYRYNPKVIMDIRNWIIDI